MSRTEQIARIIDPDAFLDTEVAADKLLGSASPYNLLRVEAARNEALAKAAAIQAPPLEGWRLVPVEPTEEMIEAMNEGFRSQRRTGAGGMSIDAQWRREYAPELSAYRAMLSAAPLVEGEGSSRSQPSRTAQEPPSPTPCDLEGGE